MQLFQMVMQTDDSWDTLNEIGKLDAVHFINLNSDKMSHEMTYAKTIRQLEEIDRKI